jgi:hypothetical protein
VGGAILQPLVGFILNLGWDGKMEGGVPFYTLANYENALFVIPIIYIIGLVVSLGFIKETNCKSIN